MHIEKFDASTDRAALRALFAMTRDGWPVDHPQEPCWPYDSFAGKWARGFDGAPRQTWLASDDAGPAGGYLLRLSEKENISIANCTLIVDPARRQSGVGRLLLEHAATQTRQAGRTRLQGHATDDTPGAAFAKASGATGGIPDVLRLLTIDESMPGRLAELRSEALSHAAGYSLLSWRDRTPDEHLDDSVRLSAAMADAPHDPGVEPWVWDAERIRHSEQVMMDHGLTSHAVAARNDASGHLVAITQICTEESAPDWAYQQLTAVLPEHRGHRLGLLVKVAMLEMLLAHYPAVRHMETGNADANAHMIAINEQLGFKPGPISRDWELAIGSA